MVNFNYYAPTKVVFGKNAEYEVANLIRSWSSRKVLIVYGGKSSIKSGLIERICNSLKDSEIDYITLGGVQPNPRLSKVYEGIHISKDNNVDFLLAVGGGSVIDTCKAIGAGLKYDGDVWDLYIGKAICQGSTPVGCVLTLSATGSEMSNGSVITNDKNLLKRSFDSDYCQCKFAIMNPEITYTLPSYQTASGCVDIIMHTLERFFSVESFDITDSIAVSIIKNIIYFSKIALDEPDNYQARANIMWSGSLSHNGLTGCGTVGDWAPHMIEHELGGMFDVTHGAGLAAIWGSWARYVVDVKPSRFAKLAHDVFGIEGSDEMNTALEGIAAMEKYFKSINMPVSLKELGIDPTDKQLEELSRNCCDDDTHTIGHFKALNSSDVKAILLAAKR